MSGKLYPGTNVSDIVCHAEIGCGIPLATVRWTCNPHNQINDRVTQVYTNVAILSIGQFMG